MKPKRIAILFLLAIAAVTVAGTKISNLTRTRTLPTNSYFVVVTGDVTRTTRRIIAEDLAIELGRWITNSGGGPGFGSVETQWYPDQTQFFTNASGVFVLKSAWRSTNGLFYETNRVIGQLEVRDRLFMTNGWTVLGNVANTNAGQLYQNNHVDLGIATTGIRMNVWTGNAVQLRTGSDLIMFDGSVLKIQSTAYISDNNDTQETNRYRFNDTSATNVVFRKFEVERLAATVSNALVSLTAANDIITSNGAIAFTMTASNTLRSLIIASDTTTSNGLVAFTMTASNTLRTTFIANDTTTSNGVVSLLVGNDTITSNGCVAVTIATSNSLRTAYIAADAIVSNAAVAFTMAASNVLDLKIENTLTNYTFFGGAVSNATSIPVVVTNKVNRQLIFINQIAGAGLTVTPTTTGMLWTASGASLADGDYGDITATAGGSVLTIDNDVVTDAKLRESEGFSVIGKSTTGTGNPADIVAGTDSILGRSGSGNLSFGTLATGQITDDAVTFAKFQNITEDRLLGRESTGSGNMEEISLSGLFLNGGTLYLSPSQRFSDIAVTNSVSIGSSNTALATNIVVDWNGKTEITSYPTNTTFMISFVNTPATSNGFSKTIRHTIILTNSPTMIGPSGIGWRNTPVLIGGTIASPSTNDFVWKFEGNTNLWAFSGQEITTGSGATVLSNAPSLYAPKIVNATASRVAIYDAQGQLTNSAGVDTTELEYLNGVTSAIQTQFDGKQNGQTNSNFFGASTTLTPKDGANITNAVLHGGTTLDTNSTAGASPFLAWKATNANMAVISVVNSNAVNVTNIIGISQKANVTPSFFDANFAQQFVITNRITAATTLVLTNTEQGQEISIVLPGEVSGGTSRTVTIVGHGGGSAAIANMDTFGTAMAASMVITLTNGNAVEINARVSRLLQSNVTAVVTRQFAF